MSSKGFQATFVRGGTSKGLLFNSVDLPRDQAEWDQIFLTAMGSPDETGRQLDGMGGGLSSLSKVGVVGPSTRPDADVDYTFAQVSIRQPVVDYSGNCGNISSAVGPFAVQQGLVRCADGPVLVRIHNTNTGKLIHSEFEVRGSQPKLEGDTSIPGVPGTGSPIKLTFIDPGGALTGSTLPTSEAVTVLDLPGRSGLEVSLVDVGNPCVFIRAEDLGLQGIESPEALDKNSDLLEFLEEVRITTSIQMGLVSSRSKARSHPALPLVALIAVPQDYFDLTETPILGVNYDLSVRVISSGTPHRALPVTGALCTAAAMLLEGTLPNRLARSSEVESLRLGTPAGLMSLEATITRKDKIPSAGSASIVRTSRFLMEGRVLF